MPLATYADLLAAVPKWAMRSGDTEFEAQVPDFVALAENRINRNLRLAGMEKTATLTADANGAVTLPADYLEWRSVGNGVRGYGEMEFVPPGEEIGSLCVSGVARRFSIAGGTLQIYPYGTGPVTFSYYAKVPALSVSAPTNWLFAQAPDLYLFGALCEAAPYMEEDQRTAIWEAKFANAMQDLRANDAGARYASGRSRVRGPTP